ncbi:MAG: phytanoyl-CoA dioxygenase family protein [Chthoniobacterales bacterium]|nr:phytanoyl-CoA dioxygenase family protein [Chthoniobacterales bacterium]
MSATTTAETWLSRRPWIDEPGASIDEYVSKVGPAPDDYDLKDQLNHWREHGIVIFEGAVSHDTIDALLADIDYLVHHPKDFEISVDLGGGRPHMPIKELEPRDLLGRTSLKLNNLHSLSKAAIRCALNKYATSFLRHIFQDTPCVQQSLFFIKGSQQPIHLDYPYVKHQQHIANLAASWVALEDVHEDSGPLEYYCGSHMPEVMPFFDWGGGSITLEANSTKDPHAFVTYLQDEVKRLGIQPRTFLPKKGDMLIWHGYLAHAGTTIRDESRTRKSLVTHYTSKSSYNPEHRYADADEKGRFYSENGGLFYDLPWTEGWNMLPSWNE